MSERKDENIVDMFKKKSSLPVTPKSASSSVVSQMFSDWQEFASTSLGFVFTVGVVILGVAAFIALSQFDMPVTGAMVFAGAVFGDLALGLVAGKLNKHGFFACCGADEENKLSCNKGVTLLNNKY